MLQPVYRCSFWSKRRRETLSSRILETDCTNVGCSMLWLHVALWCRTALTCLGRLKLLCGAARFFWLWSPSGWAILWRVRKLSRRIISELPVKTALKLSQLSLCIVKRCKYCIWSRRFKRGILSFYEYCTYFSQTALLAQLDKGRYVVSQRLGIVKGLLACPYQRRWVQREPHASLRCCKGSNLHDDSINGRAKGAADLTPLHVAKTVSTSSFVLDSPRPVVVSSTLYASRVVNHALSFLWKLHCTIQSC